MNRKLKKISAQKAAEKQKTKIYFLQAVALTNYAKLCNKLNEVPRLDLIEVLANCENATKLHESNKIFLSEL